MKIRNLNKINYFRFSLFFMRQSIYTCKVTRDSSINFQETSLKVLEDFSKYSLDTRNIGEWFRQYRFVKELFQHL